MNGYNETDNLASTMAKKHSIINPWVDLFCVGGFSIVFMVGLLIYLFMSGQLFQNGFIENPDINFGHLLIFQTLINWPHFMSSYRLLYVPAKNIRTYPFATMIVPVLLILIASIAILSGQPGSAGNIYVNQKLTYYIWLVAAFYLAWHYTGQTWGMVMCFAFLNNLQLTTQERRLVRLGLRVLLVWHVVWGGQDLPATWLGPLYQHYDLLMFSMNILAVVSFFIGIYGFIKIKQRTGVVPSAQMVVPWVAVYIWYLTLFFVPGAYLFVQLSHSLQYLIFPLRVELNRGVKPGFIQKKMHRFLLGAGFYLLWITAGVVVFYLPDIIFSNTNQVYTIALLISSIVSIHHYFLDGCIWKISNREVRARLFSHAA